MLFQAHHKMKYTLPHLINLFFKALIQLSHEKV